MSLTKSSLVERLQSSLGLSHRETQHFVDLFFEEMSLILDEGKHVKLSGFGRFVLRDKTSRPGRNPKTGEPFTISPRRVVTFKPGNKFKSELDAVADEK